MSIKLRAIQNISLDIRNGEFLMLKGDAKETSEFLDILHGLKKVKGGSMVVSGYDVFSMKRKERTNLFRTTFGILSRDFFEDSTVAENIAISGTIAKMNKREKNSRLLTISKNLGIDGILKKKMRGLKKTNLINVMVARACFMNPKIILGYEPTKGLKKENSEVLLSLLQNFSKSSHATIIIASNDETVEKFATKVLVFKEGKLK